MVYPVRGCGHALQRSGEPSIDFGGGGPATDRDIRADPVGAWRGARHAEND